MSLKKKLGFLYGIFLGTSVEYVETHKNMGPSTFEKINDSFYILKQNSHDCGILLNNSEILLINTSYGTACEDLVRYLQNNFPNHKVTHIAYSSDSEEAIGGMEYYPGHKKHIGSDNIEWGSEIIAMNNLEISLKKNRATFKNLRFQFAEK